MHLYKSHSDAVFGSDFLQEVLKEKYFVTRKKVRLFSHALFKNEKYESWLNLQLHTSQNLDVLFWTVECRLTASETAIDLHENNASHLCS